MSSVVHSQSVFRVDKFTVPLEAREAFLERLKTIRALLEGIDGCRQNLVLEQGSDSGAAKFATIVEWRDQRALETAREKGCRRIPEGGFQSAGLHAPAWRDGRHGKLFGRLAHPASGPDAPNPGPPAAPDGGPETGFPKNLRVGCGGKKSCVLRQCNRGPTRQPLLFKNTSAHLIFLD
ncbi:antibiotic biosynthesis monooxygenase [Roseibium salinum]|nr:antibiotic biosynthesis monooxygenase [Roseibium salinum]